MPINILTDKSIKSLREPGRYSDGGNLYVRVRDSGSKFFYYMTSKGGKQREISIGRYGTTAHEFSLARAREARDELTALIASGQDLPNSKASKQTEVIENPSETVLVPTFGQFAFEKISEFENGFRNAKHRAQWRTSLETYCKLFWETPVDQISHEQVFNAVQAIWHTKQETASRVQGRIAKILDLAKLQGYRSGDNPAAWEGNLKLRLGGRRKLQRGHHPAMPYSDVPDFWRHLDTQTSSCNALRFLILTAARTGEVLGAVWDEIDFDAALWTVPAAKMKAGREHRVPLSQECLSILSVMSEMRLSNYVFPGGLEDRPLSNTSLAKQLKSFSSEYTLHGFRSSFRDWAGEETVHEREIAEGCLAHRVGDATERAYRRRDALEKRRRLMDDWSRFVSGRIDQAEKGGG